MRTRALFLAVLLFGSGSAQVRTGPLDMPKMNSDMVVSTKWVAENLQNPNVVILHVGRDRTIYDAGHIPGARFLGLSDIVINSAQAENELPPATQLAKTFGDLGVGDRTRVILYGDHMGLFAARAYFTLDYLGAGTRAALIDGGLEKWKEEKRPLSKAVEPATHMNFTVRVNTEILADLATVKQASKDLARSSNSTVALVDSRPEAEFDGTSAGAGINRAGHIPGAVNVFWPRNLESEEDPSLRPPFELRQMYERLGVTRDKRVITYCRTGVQASYGYFILKWLGYDVAMYDGSYQEWSRDPANPVSTGKDASD